MNLAVGRTQGMLLAALVAALFLLIGGASAARAADGDVFFKQCVSESGTGGVCTDGANLTNAWDAAVSPDGRHAYVTAWSGGNTLQIFDRDPATGRMTPRSGVANCYRTGGGGCTDVRGMSLPLDALVSSDGKYVYIAGYGSSAITVFDRNADTGQLTQKAGTAGCLGQTATCAPGAR